MDPIRRLALALPLAAAAAALTIPSAAAQEREADAAPVLRAVARMGCGTPMPRTYSLAARGARTPGSGTYAPPPQQLVVRQAELVATLELNWGAPQHGSTAAAERPVAGTWSFTPLGYCTGGHGPLQFAVLTPPEGGHPARYDLRGPADHIQRPGERAAPERAVVRFVGSCGRRQEVIMEIWPQPLETANAQVEPERYRLVGNVNCGPVPAPAPPDASTPPAP